LLCSVHEVALTSPEAPSSGIEARGFCVTFLANNGRC